MLGSIAQSLVELKLDDKADEVPNRRCDMIYCIFILSFQNLLKQLSVCWLSMIRSSVESAFIYLTYGTLAGMWNLAPGSKSSSVRATGGHRPWYFILRCNNTLSEVILYNQCIASIYCFKITTMLNNFYDLFLATIGRGGCWTLPEVPPFFVVLRWWDTSIKHLPSPLVHQVAKR